MHRTLHILAQTLSILCYPLWIPTYGIALFCVAYSRHVLPLPPVWQGVAIGGTLLLTSVIPLTAILLLIRRGVVSDLQMNRPEERHIPYLYTTISYGFWCYLLIAMLHAPTFINIVAVGATVALALISLINRWWKISAHLTGLGGLFGGMLSYCLGIGALPTTGTWVLWLGMILALSYARLYLNAHTPAQVVSGLLTGLTCTLLPNIIAWYAA